MIYTEHRANLIAEQLRKFSDSYDYMLAGQFANIDFWMGEVIDALKIIDEHKYRFEQMYEAQKSWIEEHQTRVPNYCPYCGGPCELDDQHDKIPELPRNRYKSEKKKSRKELVNSAYKFLIRCYKIGLLDMEELEDLGEKIGISIDPYDL